MMAQNLQNTLESIRTIVIPCGCQVCLYFPAHFAGFEPSQNSRNNEIKLASQVRYVPCAFHTTATDVSAQQHHI